MSCPHASTTTLAWCYGEAEEGHAVHVATCAECQSVVDETELVLGSVGPLAPALVASPDLETRRRSRPRWTAAVVAACVLAAAVALVVRFGTAPGPAEVPTPDTDALAVVVELDQDFVDVRIDALELELDALSADPSLL